MIRSESVMDEDEQLLHQVLDRAGCRIVLVPFAGRVSLARRFELLRHGEIDLLSGVSRLPERESWAHFSKPVRRENFRVWIRRETQAQAAGKSVAELIAQGWTTIGPQQGYFGPFYQGIREDARIQTANYLDFKLGVQSLLRQRGDLLLGDESWQRIITPEQQKDILRLEEVLHSEQLHIAYSRKTVDAKTVQQLDRIIVELGLPERQPAQESP